MTLTVILRDDSPMIHCGDNPSYRSVRIELTPEQVAALAPRKTGSSGGQDEYNYASAQKGNWVLYPKIPRYTIETPPYAAGRTEFDEDGKLCYWDDVKDIVRELEELKDTVSAEIPSDFAKGYRQ